MKAVLCDLDGTLYNVSHRIHLINQSWKSFFNAIDKDIVNQWCLDLLKGMNHQGYKIILLTGRPEEYKDITKELLDRDQVPFDELIMRKNGDYRKDYEFKEQIIETIDDEIILAIDDQLAVINVFKKYNIPALHIS
ncbi:MAG: hypothetical protein INQ03_09320 [Candidatus Heimdallarchaeota archaeon]|nr:hypothetical protein [Candidatus Heimdallarchaeota archaeon]